MTDHWRCTCGLDVYVPKGKLPPLGIEHERPKPAEDSLVMLTDMPKCPGEEFRNVPF